MPKATETPKERFARLARQLAEGTEAPTAHRDGFGTGSLFVGRKMFGVFDDAGALILKLPPERVAELIGSGVGTGWHPGNGKPLREYLSIPFAQEKRWLALSKESRAYMAGKK